MKLADYMELQKIDDAALAAAIGCDRSTVTRLRNGKTIPTWKNASLIKEATKGAVTFDDFAPSAESARRPLNVQAAE